MRGYAYLDRFQHSKWLTMLRGFTHGIRCPESKHLRSTPEPN